MRLPHAPPIAPMLAELVREFPERDDLIYEPKWDGFRAIIFRDGDEVYLQSRDEKPLARYFPEVVEAVRAAFPPRAIVDGELVIAGPRGLDFGAIQQRLHPAASRIEKLSRETPASFVAFDLLALGDESLLETPFEARRARLEQILGGARGSIVLTPMTSDPARARDWFARFEGAGFDGVIAKPRSLHYQPNKRVMLKIKHRRTADCVVAGFRWYKKGEGTRIGSLLLGLFDDAGELHHVGITSTFKMAQRAALLAELAPLRDHALDGHPWADWVRAMEEAPKGRRPGMTSRWNADKDLSWEPLRIERVVEVAYDGLQNARFRHATTFVRWRIDKRPADCTYAQLEAVPPHELSEIFHSDQGS